MIVMSFYNNEYYWMKLFVKLKYLRLDLSYRLYIPDSCFLYRLRNTCTYSHLPQRCNVL